MSAPPIHEETVRPLHSPSALAAKSPATVDRCLGEKWILHTSESRAAPASMPADKSHDPVQTFHSINVSAVTWGPAMSYKANVKTGPTWARASAIASVVVSLGISNACVTLPIGERAWPSHCKPLVTENVAFAVVFSCSYLDCETLWRLTCFLPLVDGPLEVINL